MLVAVISWPDDPDRGHEVYGPFDSEQARDEWHNEVLDAAHAGDPLLAGVQILLTTMDPPFKVER